MKVHLVCIFLCGLSAGQDPRKAACFMQPDPGSTQHVGGTITIQQDNENSPTVFHVNLYGFDPVNTSVEGNTLLHGFHVHQFGDLSAGCISTGGHYNPKNVSHGGPNDSIRHAGDFGNKEQTPEGKMTLTFTDLVATLFGDDSIIGRAIVVHAGVDDLGKGSNAASLVNGNAGSMLACCVIGFAEK